MQSCLCQTTQGKNFATYDIGDFQDAQKVKFLGKLDTLWLGFVFIMNVYDNNSVQLATFDGTYFAT